MLTHPSNFKQSGQEESLLELVLDGLKDPMKQSKALEQTLNNCKMKLD
jgi:hypothetical protein